MIVVRLSQRNILALLHKLVMPGTPARSSSGAKINPASACLRSKSPFVSPPTMKCTALAGPAKCTRTLNGSYPQWKSKSPESLPKCIPAISATAMSWDQWFNLGFSVFLIGIFLVGDYLQRRHYRRNP